MEVRCCLVYFDLSKNVVLLCDWHYGTKIPFPETAAGLVDLLCKLLDRDVDPRLRLIKLCKIFGCEMKDDSDKAISYRNDSLLPSL
ncbi:unnamed protein product [Absidia cylindrospora]